MSSVESPRICWKTIAFLPLDPPLHDSTVLFNASAATGLYRQFGIVPALAYVPYTLSPTTVYHQLLRNALAKHSIKLIGSKYPYQVQLPNIGIASLNVRIRLYPPNILSLTTNVWNFPAPTCWTTKFFVDLQRLNNRSPLKDIIPFTVDASASLNHAKIERCSVPLDSKPSLHLNSLYLSSVGSQRQTSAPPRQYVAILIRNADEQLHDEVVERVLEKNKEHKLKHRDSLLLIDRQGMLCVGSADATAQPDDRFGRIADLYELALVCRAFLSDYSQLRSRNVDLVS